MYFLNAIDGTKRQHDRLWLESDMIPPHLTDFDMEKSAHDIMFVNRLTIDFLKQCSTVKVSSNISEIL